MTLIGIEEHVLTPEVTEAWHALGLAAVDPSVAFHSRAIERRLLDVGQERFALMDETGLDVQVLSLTTLVTQSQVVVDATRSIGVTDCAHSLSSGACKPG